MDSKASVENFMVHSDLVKKIKTLQKNGLLLMQLIEVIRMLDYFVPRPYISLGACNYS